MTYLSLYRKWRPQNFEEVVGQDHVTQTLSNAVSSNRVGHAYLFSGPRGTGKTSVAKILAKAINCIEGPTAIPCNKCTVCKEISAGNSVDVLEIDAASNRGVDEIRDLRERVQYMPSQGSKKIYIIDEVHMLTPEAFNALLKTLEEPPEHIIFVLATTEPHKVLPTILSRCQRFDFRRLSISDISRRVEEVAQEEKVKIDKAAVEVIARYARGSMRDALSALEQLSSFAGKNIKAEDVVSILGTSSFNSQFELMEGISKKDVKAVLLTVEKLAESGQDVRQFTKDLIEYARHLFLLKSIPDGTKIIDIAGENLSKMKNQVERFKSSQILQLIEILSHTYQQMRWEAEGRLLLEAAMIKATKWESDDSLEGILLRLEEIEEKLSEKGSAVSSSHATLNSSQEVEVKEERKPEASKLKGKNVDLERVKRAWPVILDRVKGKKISTYALLLECEPTAVTDGKVVLEFAACAGFHKDEVEKETNLSILREAFREVFGEEVPITCNLQKDEENETELKEENDSFSKQHLLEMLKDSFQADIVEEE